MMPDGRGANSLCRPFAASRERIGANYKQRRHGVGLGDCVRMQLSSCCWRYPAARSVSTAAIYGLSMMLIVTPDRCVMRRGKRQRWLARARADG